MQHICCKCVKDPSRIMFVLLDLAQCVLQDQLTCSAEFKFKVLHCVGFNISHRRQISTCSVDFGASH